MGAYTSCFQDEQPPVGASLPVAWKEDDWPIGLHGNVILCPFVPNALSSLDNIRVLDLSRNQLRSITFGAGPKSITTLNLAHNSLRYMPDMSALTSLRYVDLSNNEIETVKPSYLPPNVESLRLSANKIAHLTPWPFLRKLQKNLINISPFGGNYGHTWVEASVIRGCFARYAS
ncbi:leucine Rich repeat-containing domain protein [Cooperia oncophora]